MDTDTLVATRRTLHSLAEHLLAGDLWRRTERIGLRVTPGGFGQPEHLDGVTRRRLRIDGADLVVLEGDQERWVPLTTAADAASRVGADLGPPTGAYTPETELDPSRSLAVDPASAAALAGWLALVDQALEEVRRRQRRTRPTLVQLWPEHFDVACAITEVNLGGSPGDADHPEPYLYVGPWSPPPTGGFWNESWGASVSWREIPDVAAAVTFLEDSLRRANAAGR